MSGDAVRRPPAHLLEPTSGLGRRLCLLGATVISCLAVLLGAPALANASNPPNLSVRGAILIDESTGQELYGYAANRELPIASTTKLMTALITLEHEHHLSKVFTEPNYYPSAADSQIGLVPGERMSVHDLLLAMMLPSADDAAEDLAYNVGRRSVGYFLGMMNVRARQLGLRHTHYTTPSGLDTEGNYSTAADLVRLARYDLTHSPYFARIVALPHAVLRSGSHVRHVVNRNDLVGAVPWIKGVKTGHTSGAGYVLVASGQRSGMTLISAVLGTSSAQSRDANTLALLNYGFANFRLVQPVKDGQVLARPTVRYRPGQRVALIAQRAFERVVPRGARVQIHIEAPGQLTGPLKRHADLGTAVVMVGRRQVARIPLLLAQALPAVSALTIAARFITKPLMLLAILLLVGGGLALGFFTRRRKRARAANGGGREAA